mgnify:CR=1 FL=1
MPKEYEEEQKDSEEEQNDSEEEREVQSDVEKELIKRCKMCNFC